MTSAAIRILGIDPGLRRTGWGLVAAEGNRLRFLAAGAIVTDEALPLAQRLVQIEQALCAVIAEGAPDEAAVELTFVNANAASALKLGQARAIALLVPARAGLPVAEYAPNLIKKSIVGAGHAEKAQIRAMLRVLLPAARPASDDEADALAISICHAHHRNSRLLDAGRIPVAAAR